MQIRMHGKSELTVENLHEEGLDVVADPEIHAHFSAMEMFGASFALCSASVLAAWGEQAELDSEDLSVRIRWAYTPNPFRVGRFEISISWPSLPEEFAETAKEAVETCTIHHTFEQPPKIEVSLSTNAAAPANGVQKRERALKESGASGQEAET